MHVAVNRTEPPGSAHAGYPTARIPFLPGQRLDLATILTAYTAGSAWLNRSPAGVIGPGRAADLVVLDRDPFRLDPADIWTTKVAMTFIRGECVADNRSARQHG
jgi:predicted amidohydrolase YtcJ